MTRSASMADGPEFDYNFGAIQTGIDLYRKEDARTVSATMPASISPSARAMPTSSTTCSAVTFKGGEDDFDAVSVGGYWTRFGEDNWYLDGVVQATWYDMDMTGRRGLRDGETDGFGLAASLEGGYPFDLGNDWLLEPQAQLVYQTLNIDDFNDGAADVRYSDTNSLAGRIGARLARRLGCRGGARRRRQGVPPEVRQASSGCAPTSGTSSSASRRRSSPRRPALSPSPPTRRQLGKLGIGGTWDFDTDATLYGNVNYATSFDGDAYAWEGKVGVKVQW